MIVNNLRRPDIVGLEEIQDNNGADATTARSSTRPDARTRSIAAIQRGRRPDLPVPPDRPGQRPGWRRAGRQHPRRLPVPHRPRPRVRRPAGRRLDDAGRGRRRPDGPAAVRSARAASTRPTRPSTPAASRWRPSSPSTASTLFVIANHFNSKGGDQPLFGRFQPPVRSVRGPAAPAGDAGRRLRRATSSRPIRRRTSWSLGDLNDFEFSPPLRTLKDGGPRST